MEPYNEVLGNEDLSRQIFDVRGMRSFNKHLREKSYDEALDDVLGKTITTDNAINWISRHPEAMFRVYIVAGRGYRNYYNDVWSNIVSTGTPNEYIEIKREGDSFLENTMTDFHMDRDVMIKALYDIVKGNITRDVRMLLNVEDHEDLEVSHMYVKLGYIDAYEYMLEILTYMEGDGSYPFEAALEDYILSFLVEKDVGEMNKFVLSYWLKLNLASMDDGDFSFVDEYSSADGTTWSSEEIDLGQLDELDSAVRVALNEYINNF